MKSRTFPSAALLIIDDEPANSILLRRLLAREGYTNIHEVTDSRRALAEIQRIQPDLILLDLHMPNIDGIEILQALRSSENGSTFRPVLVLTANVNAANKHEALAVGANDFLTKPFDTSEVLLRVRNLLETRELHLHMRTLVADRTLALERAQVEMLERLAQAGEYRDDDTGQHTRRVGEMSADLAQALGLPASAVQLIRQAAPLHDVGKIGIPDSILLKPGRLNPQEWAIMRSHTTCGANILSGGVSDLVQLAEEIAHCHHEWWDGSGYPSGLLGETIPLAARIVATVDVYDALSHDRPYRAAWEPQRVIDEIEKAAGTQFDPAVVRALLDNIVAPGTSDGDFSPPPPLVPQSCPRC